LSASFAATAEAHLDDVYGYLVYLTRDRTLAEDLAAETFEKALKLWRRFDPRRASARTWLCQIARTTALDWFRSEERRQRREERAALWQVLPLLTHAALFGGGYGASAVSAMKRYV